MGIQRVAIALGSLLVAGCADLTEHDKWLFEIGVQSLVALGTSLAVVVALFREWIIAVFFPPRFLIRLESSSGELTKSGSIPIRLHHIRIENRTKRMATDVHVVMTRLHVRGANDEQGSAWNGEALMRWRHEEAFSVESRFRKVGRAPVHCDFVLVVKGGALHFWLHSTPNSLPSQHNGPCHLDVTVEVRSNERKPVEARFLIVWDGEWDDDDQRMSQHLQVVQRPR